MKEMFKSKVMIAFIIFVLLVFCIYDPQKNDSPRIEEPTNQIENINK